MNYSNNYDFVTFALPSRYRDVTVPLQFTVPRYGPLPFFLKGYIPLPFVTDRDTIVTCVTERYMRYRTLHALQNVTERYRALQSVTERYRALQNVTYGIYKFSKIQMKKLMNMLENNNFILKQ